jgi:pyruvate dehydrogenase E2 component (dihydrolipoamide acetyltransferase)
MAIEIVVPRLGWSMDEGSFGEWLKEDGQQVNIGDMLFVLESDKVDQEVESLDAGILRIPPEAPKPGDTVVVGQLLAYLVEEGQPAPFEVEGRESTVEKAPETVPVKEVRVRAEAVTAESAKPLATTRAAISPRAKRIARELGVDWAGIVGSGHDGRIQECDIREAAASASSGPVSRSNRATPGGRLTRIAGFRRTIAERMLAGVYQAAPVTLTTKAHATALVNFRRRFKEANSAAGPVPSYTDLLVKLSAAALQDHQQMAGQWRDDGIFVPDQCNISFAVDTEAGVMAPVIHDVPGKSLRQVAVESRELTKLARDGGLSAEQMQGGTFTITNLGRFGVDTFTPIINLPQAAILGVGRIVLEPVVLEGQVVAREMLSLSLTFDHRVTDGAPAARFLDTLRACIEDPSPWLTP